MSTSASEISSQAGEGDFEDNTLVSTPNQQVEQVLVVQAQNGVNMADPPLPRGTCTATSPKRAEHTLTPAQDLEAFKADMTSMLSDMLQAFLSKFASQFNPSSGGQADTAPTQTVASEPTVDVASNDDDSPPWGPEDRSEGEIIDSEGEPADLTVAGIPILDNLKMSEEEQREYNEFSLAKSLFQRRLNDPGGLWEIRTLRNLSPRMFLTFAMLALRPQPRLFQLSRLSLIRDQSNFSPTRDKSSFVRLRTRLTFLSWRPKVKVIGKA